MLRKGVQAIAYQRTSNTPAGGICLKIRFSEFN